MSGAVHRRSATHVANRVRYRGVERKLDRAAQRSADMEFVRTAGPHAITSTITASSRAVGPYASFECPGRCRDESLLLKTRKSR